MRTVSYAHDLAAALRETANEIDAAAIKASTMPPIEAAARIALYTKNPWRKCDPVELISQAQWDYEDAAALLEGRADIEDGPDADAND